MSALHSIIAFVGVILVRVALLMAVLLVIAIPIALVVKGVEAIRALRERSRGLRRVGRMLWQQDLHYAAGHTWVRRESEEELRIGLDDLAQRLFPCELRVELRPPGTEVRAGDPVAEIICGAKRATVHAPVAGTIVAVNETLRREPAWIHRDPYARGWLVTVKPRDARYAELASGEPARRWLEEEAGRLSQVLERDLAIMGADGGELLAEGPTLMRKDRWEAMAQDFLKAS